MVGSLEVPASAVAPGRLVFAFGNMSGAAEAARSGEKNAYGGLDVKFGLSPSWAARQKCPNPLLYHTAQSMSIKNSLIDNYKRIS